MDFLDSIHLFRHLTKSEKRIIEDFNRQSLNVHGHTTLFNWWRSGSYLWFTQRYEEKLAAAGKQMNLCSLFGDRRVLEHVSGIKVFYSGENVHNSPYDEYSDYLLRDKSTSLGIGFEYFENKRYLRFPLWILYMFKPTSTRQDIIDRCRELRYPEVSGKTRFCSMVASHDWNGLRRIMVDQLKSIDTVDCPGKYLHNDNRLKSAYNDDKIAYLRQYYFNICPENSNCAGYVTEKAFEAISAGCIPVYWGDYNTPEPSVLNEEAILFWNKDQDNKDLIQKISHLFSSPEEMDRFLRLPRLKDGAEDVIWGMIESLDSAMDSLLKA